MTEKTNKSTLIDGDGFEAYCPYRSKCSECKHFKLTDYNCKAFPGGIPEKYLSGKETHNKVIASQIGTTILTT